MQIKILVFGQLTDITEHSEIILNDVSDTDSLIAMLKQKYPGLADSKYAIALNKKVVSQNTKLSDNSIVALLPPFSGG